jgi:hypothetical protein
MFAIFGLQFQNIISQMFNEHFSLYLMMSVREYKSFKTRLVTYVSYAVIFNRGILSRDLVIMDRFWIDDQIY